MISILCRNNSLIARVNKGEVVTAPPSISDAKKVAQMFLTDMKYESNMPASSYNGEPKSYSYFPLGTQPTSRPVLQDEADFDTPPKRRKTELITKTNTTTTTIRDKSVSFAESVVEKSERRDSLLLSDQQKFLLPNTPR